MGILEYQNTPQVLTARSFLVAGFNTRWVPRRVSCGVQYRRTCINRDKEGGEQKRPMMRGVGLLYTCRVIKVIPIMVSPSGAGRNPSLGNRQLVAQARMSIQVFTTILKKFTLASLAP